MQIKDFDKKLKTPIVLALGYFESVHLGHRRVIAECVKLSAQLNCKSAVFTFTGDFKGLPVFTFQERADKIKKLNPDYLICAEFDKIKDMSGGEFVGRLTENFNIKAVVCGRDFRYGAGAKSSVGDLKKVFQTKIIEDCIYAGEKVSTSLIKEQLAAGMIEKANHILGENYAVTGSVKEGRQFGRAVGFPTANIQIEQDKLRLKAGVYAISAIIQNKEYKGIANYGTRPTFDGKDELLETHLIDFDGNVYGKDMTVMFYKFIRPIKKFKSKDELIAQIKEDISGL